MTTRAARPPVIDRSFRRVVTHGPGAPPEIVAALRDGTDALLSGATVLKEGDRCTVVRLDAGGRPLVLKRYNLKQPAHTATHLLLRSRAAWCWSNGHRLLRAGLRTPEPLAYCEHRVGPLRFQSYLLTTYVEGPTLRDFIRAGDPSPADLDRVARSFARVWHGLGVLRAGHDDTKATNFIVGDDGELWMIDLDGMRIGLPAPLFARTRRNDFERFMRNWRGRPEVAEAFRARIDTA
jgi:tRNA A-37 threonylcarbamoyl transferase component Bud32